MTEDEDLEVPGDVISVTLAADDEETDEGAGDEVDERPVGYENSIMPP
jgi:hypothetical protein